MSSSEFESGSNSFIWKIANFSFFVKRTHGYFEIPGFMQNPVSQDNWVLRLYPNGLNSPSDGTVYFSIFTADSQNSNSSISFIIFIVCADGSLKRLEEKVNYPFTKAHSSSVRLVAREELLKNAKDYLPEDTLTLRCDVRKCVTEKPPGRIYTIHTQVGVERISVPWDIPNFTRLNLKQHLALPLPTSWTNAAPLFAVDFYLDGDILESSFIQLDIKKMSQYDQRYRAKRGEVPNSSTPTLESYYDCGMLLQCKVSAVTMKGENELVSDSRHYFESSRKDSVFNMPTFKRRRSFFVERRVLYLPGDVLSLRFEFACTDGNYTSLPSEIQTFYHPLVCGEHSTLRKDLRSLYKDEKFCNVALRATDGTVHNAHLGIICSRSPVLNGIFTSLTAKKSTGIVDVPGVDGETLDRMLLYMYSDELEGLDYNVGKKLYIAAAEYQISSLKEQCSVFLRSAITSIHLPDILSLANKYNDETMKKSAKSFLSTNPSALDYFKWDHLTLDPKDRVSTSSDVEVLNTSEVIEIGSTIREIHTRASKKRKS